MAENNSWMIGYYYLNEWVKKKFEVVAYAAINGMNSSKAVMGVLDEKAKDKEREKNPRLSSNVRSFGGGNVSKERGEQILKEKKSAFRSDKFQVLSEKNYSSKEETYPSFKMTA